MRVRESQFMEEVMCVFVCVFVCAREFRRRKDKLMSQPVKCSLYDFLFTVTVIILFLLLSLPLALYFFYIFSKRAKKWV